MGASEEFKEAIKKGKLAEALMLAMSQAVELKITTWVATPETEATGKKGKRLKTKFNLIEGIENEIGEELIGKYQELQKLHFSQVAAGSETIKNNLESLEKMLILMGNIQQNDQLEEENYYLSSAENESLTIEAEKRAVNLVKEQEELETEEEKIIDLRVGKTTEEEKEAIALNIETEENLEIVGQQDEEKQDEIVELEIENIAVEAIPEGEEEKIFETELATENIEETTPQAEKEKIFETELATENIEEAALEWEEEKQDEAEELEIENIAVEAIPEGEEEKIFETEFKIENIEEATPQAEEEKIFETELATENIEEETLKWEEEAQTETKEELTSEEEWEELLETDEVKNETSSAEDEDWGDWMTEEAEETSKIPNLEALDLEDDRDWEEELETSEEINSEKDNSFSFEDWLNDEEQSNKQEEKTEQ